MVTVIAFIAADTSSCVFLYDTHVDPIPSHYRIWTDERVQWLDPATRADMVNVRPEDGSRGRTDESPASYRTPQMHTDREGGV